MSEKPDRYSKCQNCGQLNPKAATKCVSCGATLVAADSPGLPPFTGVLPPVEVGDSAAGPTLKFPAGRKAGNDLPEWLNQLRDEGSIYYPGEAGQAAAKDEEELNTSPGEQDSSKIPDWLSEISSGNAETGQNFAGKANTKPFPSLPPFTIGSMKTTEALGGGSPTRPDSEQNVTPFDPLSLDQDSPENPLRLPSTADLGTGIPEWLRDLTSSANKNPVRQTNFLQDQPVFEPVTPTNEILPDWLHEETAEEHTDQSQPASTEQLPSGQPVWLSPGQVVESEEELEPLKQHKFGDNLLQNTLTEAFDESVTSDGGKHPIDYKALFDFDVEEFPIEETNRKEEQVVVPPKKAPVEVSPETSSLEDSYTEIEPDSKMPWDLSSSPWLDALSPPASSAEASVPDIVEDTRPFNLSDAVPGNTTPDWFVPPDSLFEQGAAVADPLSTGETRPISLNELIRRTDELAKSSELPTTGDLVDPKEHQESQNFDSAPFTDLPDADAISGQSSSTRPFKLLENLPVVRGEKTDQGSLFDLPDWLDATGSNFWGNTGLPEDAGVDPTEASGDAPEQENTPAGEALPGMSNWLKLNPASEASQTFYTGIDLPQWMGFAGDNREQEPDSASPLPGWLQNAGDQEFAEVPVSQPVSITPEGTAGWLEPQAINELAENLELPPESISEWAIPDAGDAAGQPDELPDWLKPATSEPLSPPLKESKEPDPGQLGIAPLGIPPFVVEPASGSRKTTGALTGFEPGTPAEPEENADPPNWLVDFAKGSNSVQVPTETPKSYTQVGSSALDEQMADIPEWLKDTEPLQEKPPAPIPEYTRDSFIGALLQNISLADDTGSETDNFPEWLSREKKPEIAPEEVAPLPESILEWMTPEDSSYNEHDILLDYPQPAEQSNIEATPAVPQENVDFLSEIDMPAWLVKAAMPDEPDAEPVNKEAAEPVLQAPAISPEPVAPEMASPASQETADLSALVDLPVESGTEPAGIAAQPFPVVPDLPESFPAPPLDPDMLPAWMVGPNDAENGDNDKAAEGGNLPAVEIPAALAGAVVLETLLRPAQAEKPEQKKKRFTTGLNKAWLLRVAGFLALFLVVAFGLKQAPLAGMAVSITPETRQFYNVVNNLQPGQKVLVAYDWDAEKIGEMKPLSADITRHIMSRQARLVTLSLNPQGPVLASQVTDDLATKTASGNATSGFYTYGNGYLNLGYRPGNEAAVRGLFQNLGTLEDYKNGLTASSYKVMQGINGLEDFDLIVVLAGDEGSVRTWVEQLGVHRETPLLLATPAAIAPFARPYALGPTTAQADITGNYVRAQGLLAGLSDGTRYEKLLNEQNIPSGSGVSLDSRLNAQSYAVLALIVFIVIANLVYLVTRRRGSK